MRADTIKRLAVSAESNGSCPGWSVVKQEDLRTVLAMIERQSEANSFLYTLLGSAPETAASILRSNPEMRAKLHREIYSCPEESYDDMMARLLPDGLPQAREEAQPVARKVAENLIDIVEGIGGIQHGTWRDEKGMRLKDTPAWAAFYVAARNNTHPAPDATRIAVEALEKIKAGVVEVFDDELQCNVEASMDGEEASEIAAEALAALQAEQGAK